MNKSKKKELIKEAKYYLTNTPRNLLHGLDHAKRVWKNALTIISEEKISNIDLDILEILCYWHDVYIPELEESSDYSKITTLTAQYLAKKFPKNQQEKIFDSINNHEFGSKPNFLEGKVLQDADKLDVITKIRFNEAIKAIKTGDETKEGILKIMKLVKNKWLPIFSDKLHFQYSKDYFKSIVNDYAEFLDKKIFELQKS